MYGTKLNEDTLRVCYLGGSITEQRNGYRPRVHRWFQCKTAAKVKVEEVPAFCGNCGSKVLAFMVADWVVARRPHMVFIELAINDGDCLLETEDPESIGSALEGIIRHIRDALPRCELCLLHMFIRDDLPLRLRSGSKAWAENEDADAAATYLLRVPRLHDRIAERYGIPSISLGPIMQRLSTHLRDRAFRDDCHYNELGGAFAAASICAALQVILHPLPTGCDAAAASDVASIARLPPPVHSRPWGRGRAQAVEPSQLSFLYLKDAPVDPARVQQVQQQLLQRHTQMDVDPLQNVDPVTGMPKQRAWWLLYPGETAELTFTGTRLGFLTMIGPDAGIVSCEVDGGQWRCRTNLLDRWAYFFRLSVVPLIDDLPPGRHTAILRFEEEKPDRSVLKKAPSGPHWAAFQREGKAHKLWLMHWLIEEESALERAVVRSATAPSGDNGSAQLVPLPNARLGGAGMAAGGRRADAYG